MMHPSQSVMVTGWLAFALISLGAVLFSVVYILKYRSSMEKRCLSTTVATFSLLIAFVTCSLLPVDIFLVSVTKHHNGTYKEWATDSVRSTIEDGVLYTYYAFYSLICFFIFLLLPVSFFYYDDIYEDVAVTKRLCSGFKYALIFVALGTMLFLVGAFVPFKELPTNFTASSAEGVLQTILTVEGAHHHRWENAISFVMSALTAVGMVFLVVYTGYGLAAWPMDLVKGRRSVSRESQYIAEERQNIQSRIDVIRDKYSQSEAMSRRDRRRVEDLEDQLHREVNRERYLARLSTSLQRKCGACLRPVRVILGVVLLLLALLVMISLAIVNVDRLLYSGGFKTGYILPRQATSDPLDIVLLYAQKVFPLDYIIMIFLVCYFFFCTMAAFRDLGIRCVCIKLYKVQPFRTRPQALVFLSFLLMFIVLAIMNMLYQLAPTYSMFGFQHYWDSAKNVTEPCTVQHLDSCTMTRMAVLITRFSYKFWFFATSYFWLSWAFLLVSVVSFLVTFIRKRRSLIEGATDSDSFNDSDEELLPP